MKPTLLHWFLLSFLAPAICQAQVSFSPSYLSTGNSLSAIAAGDFNGDGKADIATTSYYYPNDTLYILLGNGAGGFSTSASFELSSGTTDLLATDLNGDGKVDLVVANGNASLSVFLGDGTGGLTLTGNLAVDSYPIGIAVGDFNGDGKKDLATANYNYVALLLGNGMGEFAAAKFFTNGLHPNDLVARDFNGDGKTDLATANNGNNTVSVLLSDGLDGFALPVSYPVGTNPYDLISEDVNQDGNFDLIIAQNDKILILLGNGSGQFNPGSSFLTVSLGSKKVEAADFDGDSKTDMAIYSPNSNFVTINFGDGIGNFLAGPAFAVDSLYDYNYYYYQRELAVGDFNLDGKADLLSSSLASGAANWIAFLTLLINTTPKLTTTLPTISSFTPSKGSVEYSVVIAGVVQNLGCW